jgi:hypothetical protein
MPTPGLFQIVGYDTRQGRDQLLWLEWFLCGVGEFWLSEPALILPSFEQLLLANTTEEIGHAETCQKCPKQLSCLSGARNKLTMDEVKFLADGQEYW